MVYLFPPILDAIFSLILVFSVVNLTRSVMKSTGRKQNILLVNLHICNLLLLIVILALKAVYYHKAESVPYGSKQYWTFYYYQMLTELGSEFVDIYVDLFLLWLLYRFMKPQKILEDGRTEANALLFAHDAESAEQSLLT